MIDRPASPAALQHGLVGRSDSAHETQALPTYGMCVPAAARGLGWGSGVCGLSPLPSAVMPSTFLLSGAAQWQEGAHPAPGDGAWV